MLTLALFKFGSGCFSFFFLFFFNSACLLIDCCERAFLRLDDFETFLDVVNAAILLWSDLNLLSGFDIGWLQQHRSSKSPNGQISDQIVVMFKLIKIVMQREANNLAPLLLPNNIVNFSSIQHICCLKRISSRLENLSKGVFRRPNKLSQCSKTVL